MRGRGAFIVQKDGEGVRTMPCQRKASVMTVSAARCVARCRVDGHRSAVFELKRYPDLVARRDRAVEADQHHVGAAGLKRGGGPWR